MNSHIDSFGGNQYARIAEPIAPRDCALLDASQIEGAALTCDTEFARTILRVNATNSSGKVSWHDDDRVADVYSSREHGASDDGAVARQREDSIDRQSEQSVSAALRHGRGCGMQMFSKRDRPRIVRVRRLH